MSSREMSEPTSNPFGGLMAEAMRHSRTEAQTRYELDTLRALLDCPAGGRILDVPCGDGRLALALAGKGYAVTGVDLTRTLLETARQAAAARQLDVTFDERDMRDLPWREHFDAALCFWESFGYFDDAGNLAFARAIAAALKPGGRFLLDTQIAETLFPRLGDRRDWVMLGDILALEERTYELETGRLRLQWSFRRGAEVEDAALRIRIYTYRELCALLTEAGFGAFEAYSFLSEAPFKPTAQRLLLAAVKSAD